MAWSFFDGEHIVLSLKRDLGGYSMDPGDGAVEGELDGTGIDGEIPKYRHHHSFKIIGTAD